MEREKDDLISVIIPVYNVQAYLEQALDSVCAQTHTNLEIIIVDDGSTDGCPEICDAYEKKDSRVRVIHQKNKGLSMARNLGIEIATGKYLGFVDSDDFIEKDMYEKMLEHLKREQADCVICNYDCYTDATKEFKKTDDTRKVEQFQGLLALNNMYLKKYEEPARTCVAWNKLWRREVFGDIRYPKGKQNEDNFVIHHLLEQSGRIVYCNQTFYHYRLHRNSIMAQPFSLKKLDDLEARRDRIYSTRYKLDSQLYTKVFCDYFNYAMDCYGRLKDEMPEEQKIAKDLKQQLKKDRKELKKEIMLSKKQCMKIAIFFLFGEHYLHWKKRKNSWPFIS